MPRPEPIHFGVSVGHGGATLIEGAKAFATVLSSIAGQPVRLSVVGSYQKLLEGVLGGTIETAWLPPLLLAQAHHAGVPVAVVPLRRGSSSYRSVLLVRAESPFTRVTDLAAARAAWTDPESAAGCVFPRRHLAQAGKPPASETFLGSFMAACAAVTDGQADVCACFVNEASVSSHELLLAEVARVFPPAPWRLRVLDVTQPIPPDGVTLARTLAAEPAQRLRAALLEMHEHSPGSLALGKLLFAERLVEPTPAVLAELTRLAATHDGGGG